MLHLHSVVRKKPNVQKTKSNLPLISKTTIANYDLIIQTKLADDKGDQRNVTIQYWPTRDKTKIIIESAIFYTVANYKTTSYFNKGIN